MDFFLKGSNSLDWGIKNDWPGFFNPGPDGQSCWPSITGIFRDPPPVWNGSDIIFPSPGALSGHLDAARGFCADCAALFSNSICLRVFGGSSILKELSDEDIAVDIEIPYR